MASQNENEKQINKKDENSVKDVVAVGK